MGREITGVVFSQKPCSDPGDNNQLAGAASDTGHAET